MKTNAVIERLVALAPDVCVRTAAARGGVLLDNRCILMTAIGLDVLKDFRILAEPLSVRAMLANKAWLNWMQEPSFSDRSVLERDRRGAWMLDVATPEALCAAGIHADDWQVESGTNHWHGHLVIYLPDRATVIDLNLGQFARPAKAIFVPPAGRFTFVNGDCCYHLPHGAELRYVARPDDRSYQVSREWRDPARRAPFVRALLRAIKKA